MFRLESKILQREFVVHEGTLYASQIRNVLSGQDFVPDGNSVEFLFHFTDGSEFSSKGLKVADSKQENGKLSFKFEETQGITVTMTFWPGDDGSTLKKQISFVQTGDKTIDYILLEHIGITNSKAHFSVPTDIKGPELNGYLSALGQPFYIDTLFFGCEFPGTQNIILYGIGQVKYYIGKKINGEYKCPVTVVGGAKSDLLVDVQKAFYDYIESIAAPTLMLLTTAGLIINQAFGVLTKSFLTNFTISLSLPLISALNSACGSVHVAVTAGLIYLQRKWKSVVSEHIMQRLRTFV